MSYTVLARKYRPQTFADLVGQEHVSRTLGNALRSDRVAHAFLFTGARGVGKTTTARLLAKALNCEKGPTPTPCNECDPCREIAAGNDIDVLEIDGASNNGVDDVRRLQETLPFRPARDRFKIVIVDEVHMLSVGAFNAFLKTLEEPPPHVKFVFATTEIHKVPITIRSRCQRYDFRLIPHAVVAAKVREILAAEHVSADDAAVALVAREAAGSMRDALTVLDQVLAFGDTELHGDSVARGLAIASREHVVATVEALLGGDASACLQRVAIVAEQGLDLLHFTRQLLESARDLVVLRVVGDTEVALALTPDELSRAQKVAQAHEREELERLFSGLTKLIEDVGQATMPQMILEMGLVRLASRPPLVSVKELITRLQSFEELLSGGGGPSPSGPGGARGPDGPAGGGANPHGQGSRRPTFSGPGGAQARTAQGPYAASARQSGDEASAAADSRSTATRTGAASAAMEPARPGPRLVAVPSPAPTSPANHANHANHVNHDVRPAGRLPGSSGSATGAEPSPAPTAATHNLSAGAAAALRISQTHALSRSGTHSTPVSVSNVPSSAEGTAKAAVTVAAAPARLTPPAQTSEALAASAVPASPAGQAGAAPAPAPTHTAPAPDNDDAARSLVEPAAPGFIDNSDTDWARIVGHIRTAQPALGAVLDHGMPIEVTATSLHIGFPDGSFFGRQAQSNTAREALLKAAEQVLGARPSLVIGSPGDAKVSTLAEIEDDNRKAKTAAKREAALRHPAVLDAMEVFEESEASVDVHVDVE